MSYVPYEVITVIFQFLPFELATRMSGVSRTWHKAFRFHQPLDEKWHLRDLLGECCRGKLLSGVKCIGEHCRGLRPWIATLIMIASINYIDIIKCLVSYDQLRHLDVGLVLGLVKHPRNKDLSQYLIEVWNAKAAKPFTDFHEFPF